MQARHRLFLRGARQICRKVDVDEQTKPGPAPLHHGPALGRLIAAGLSTVRTDPLGPAKIIHRIQKAGAEIVEMLHRIPLAISAKSGYTIGDGRTAVYIRPQEGSAMSEAFGPDFITVTDEDGNDIELELVDALEHGGVTYMAFYPAVEEGADEDGEEYGMVILKSIQENGEELLSTLDSDQELDEIYALFMERLFEEDGGEDDED